jgi:hypothetical protein
MGDGKSNASVQGYGRLIVQGPDGNVKSDTGWVKNNFVNAGKVACAQKMSGAAAPAAFDYIAVGTANTAENDTQTALGGEITDSGLARAQDGTPTTSSTNVNNDTMEINYSWSVTGSKTIQEIGCFNSNSGGTMIGRSVVSPSVGVASGDTCNGLYKVIFA